MGNSMHRLLAATIAAAVIGIGSTGSVWADEGALNHRKAVMKAIGGHMGAIVAIIKGQVPFKEDLKGHAHAMAELAKTSAKIFPKGSDVGQTTISPAVWEKPAEFDAALKAFQTASADLVTAADGGFDSFMGKFGALGKSCKGCHSNFRVKK